jgi:competence protein ComEA
MKEFTMKKLLLLIVLPLSIFGLLQTSALAAGKTTHHRRVFAAAAQQNKVNINQANADQLTSLKGIGVKRAQAIVAYRDAHGRFASVNDLIKVKGISQKRLQRLLKNNPGRMVTR